MNWKVQRDPFYSELFEQHGKEFVEDAGFFEDTATTNTNVLDSLNILCTPIDFLRKGLKQAIENEAKPCVLLITGSFCPIHLGHEEMMHTAYNNVNELGFQPIGGYFSPGHDEYISQKTKELQIPIHKRISLIADCCDNWISVDPWEGMFNKVAVNFTDVIVRLEAYIEKHLGQKIPVVFVCGGDNARFAKTFLNKGHCVVTGRPGYDQYEKYKEELKDYRNIMFTDMSNDESSTSVRKRATWLYKPEKKKQLFIRYESFGEFERKLEYKLKRYYSYVKGEYLRLQNADFELMPENKISLDSLLKSKHNIAISRCYDILGIDSIRDNKYVNRPGYPSIEEQISNIPGGDYYLFDDDIHTGNTMKYVQNQIRIKNKDVNIIGELCLVTSNNENIEILDSRDFEIGHKNGGLVIKLPNNIITRAPYMYPYVCPYVRANISDPLQFSIDMWKLNMNRYFTGGKQLKDFKFKELYQYVGFSDESTIYDICKWHYDLLTDIKGE